MSEKKVIDIIKKEGPIRPGDVANLSGLEKKEVLDIIKKLKSEEKIYSPKRCYYSYK